MLQFLKLDHYSSDVLTLIFFGTVIAGVVIGYLTDAVMGERGFGPVGNGALAVLGGLVGIFIRNAYFGRMNPGDLWLTSIFAVSAATLLLLLLGVVKHWVQD